MNYKEAYNFIFNEIGQKDGETLMYLIAEDSLTEGIQLIEKVTSCENSVAKIIWVDLKQEYGTSDTNPFIYAKELGKVEQKKTSDINIPQCPICQSTNLSKITATKKVAKIAAFGIFGMGDNGKTWKCNNCGSKF